MYEIKYIAFIPLTKYLAEAPLKSRVFLFDVTSFAHQHLSIICHSSQLFTSQGLSGWMGLDAHFQVSPEYLTGFNPRLWLGHSQSCLLATLVVCLGSLSCWKLNLLHSLGFWVLWTGFSLRPSQYLVHWAFFLLWRVLQSLLLKNIPKHEAAYQNTLLLGWYSARDEQSWFPSNMKLGIEHHQTRESCFSQSEGPLGAF